MDKRWKTNSNSVYNIGYPIIWCPKYRRRVLVGDIESRLKELLIEKSNKNGWDVEELEIMPDHIHIFIKATPSDSIGHIVSQLKRKEFKGLKNRVTYIMDQIFLCRNYRSHFRRYY